MAPLPDARGHFGRFGGRFVPEVLMAPLVELEKAYGAARRDRKFQVRLAALLRDYAGRPTPLYHAARLTEHCGGARIWLKREDLCHTGAHKINNVLGQALLAERMGKRRIIAETGAGQHGVATATFCALFNLPCVIYMGATDIERQAPNVFRMKLLGAKVNAVASGAQTLKDAMNEALRDWVTNVRDTYYLIGTAAGPHPYPAMVRDFQSVIGNEVREQIMEAEGRLPDALVAAIGGGSNAIGLFHPFLADAGVRLVGIEAGGRGDAPGENAATLACGRPGVLHGCYTMLLQDAHGQVLETHSVSAGLDYSAVGPEHALLQAIGRVEYGVARDAEALSAARECAGLEGILPALESAHALAGARQYAMRHPGQRILVGLSGRGDKDLATFMAEGD